MMKLFNFAPAPHCEVHGPPRHQVNKSLLFMVLVSLSLIAGHVWLAGPAGPAGAAQPSFLPRLTRELWGILFDEDGILRELYEILPYFLVGILLAGYLRTYKVAGKLHALLRRHGLFSVFIASIIGIITPLCACGTVTTAVSLLFAGLPLAPVMSLMIASSLLSPSTYLLTLNDLGPEWTVIRTVAAFAMGIFAGLVTHLLRRHFRTDELFVEGAITVGDFHDEDYPDERLRCNCRRKLGNRVAMRTRNKFLIFLAKSVEMLWPVGKYVLVGVTMGIIVERYVPPEWIYWLFGRRDPLNIVWITLASVPMFLHQISASSIIYHLKGSLDGTLDGGAALAFMIGGPVTAIPAMVMFWTIFKKRVFFLYLTVCVLGTIMISYAFETLVFVPGMDTGNALLKGVAEVSGGDTCALRRQNENARIVMDPGGKGIVATYHNDLSGGGGVVFDTDPRRFRQSSPGRDDNRTYVANIASWLDQNSIATVKGKILVYDLSAAQGPGGGALGPGIRDKLAKLRLTVEATGRGKAPEITAGMLEGYNQLWLFDGDDSSGERLSEREINAIASFVDSGRGMLLVAGNYQPGRDKDLAINRLSSRYGVIFGGRAKNQDEIMTSIASQMFYRTSKMLGEFLKFMHKT